LSLGGKKKKGPLQEWEKKDLPWGEGKRNPRNRPAERIYYPNDLKGKGGDIEFCF